MSHRVHGLGGGLCGVCRQWHEDRVLDAEASAEKGVRLAPAAESLCVLSSRSVDRDLFG